MAENFNEKAIRIRDWFRSQRKKDILGNTLTNKVVLIFFVIITFFVIVKNVQKKKIFENWENQILSKNFMEQTHPTPKEYEELYFYYFDILSLYLLCETRTLNLKL